MEGKSTGETSTYTVKGVDVVHLKIGQKQMLLNGRLLGSNQLQSVAHGPISFYSSCSSVSSPFSLL